MLRAQDAFALISEVSEPSPNLWELLASGNGAGASGGETRSRFWGSSSPGRAWNQV